MNSETLKLLSELEKFSKTNKGMANISHATGQFLHNLVLSTKSKNILEIGTSNGYSGIWLADAARENKGKLTTIEKDDSKFNLAISNFKKSKLDVNLVHGDAIEAIPKLKGTYDFLFLDATKKNYIDYLKLALEKLDDGAVIVADNIVSHKSKVKEYVKFVRDHFKSVLVPIGKGVEFTIKTGPSISLLQKIQPKK